MNTKTNTKQHFGHNVRAWREGEGLSRKALGRQLGIAEHNVQYLEATGSYGTAGPAVRKQLAKLMGLTPVTKVETMANAPTPPPPLVLKPKKAAKLLPLARVLIGGIESHHISEELAEDLLKAAAAGGWIET